MSQIDTDIDLWMVEVFNDAYTPMSFVISIMMSVFQKQLLEATSIMMFVHENDVIQLGPYTKDIAHTRVDRLIALSDEAGFPLYAAATAVQPSH